MQLILSNSVACPADCECKLVWLSVDHFSIQSICKSTFWSLVVTVLVVCNAILHPICPSVCLSVWGLVTLYLLWFFLLYCSCPNALVTSNKAPTHLHASGVAIYPALLILIGTFILCFLSQKWGNLFSFQPKHLCKGLPKSVCLLRLSAQCSACTGMSVCLSQ